MWGNIQKLQELFSIIIMLIFGSFEEWGNCGHCGILLFNFLDGILEFPIESLQEVSLPSAWG